MKTTNWQTKALTLFIAAAALLTIGGCAGKAVHPDSSAHRLGGQGKTGKRRTLFLAIFGGGLFVAVLAVGVVLYMRTPPYEDILGLEPCGEDINLDVLHIGMSIQAPFTTDFSSSWPIKLEDLDDNPDDSPSEVIDAAITIMEHKDRFRPIPDFEVVAVEQLWLPTSEGSAKPWPGKYGILARIDFFWEWNFSEVEDREYWLSGCLDGYPVLVAKAWTYPMDAVIR